MVEVLGLDPVFRTSGGKGGGIIGVSVLPYHPFVFPFYYQRSPKLSDRHELTSELCL